MSKFRKYVIILILSVLLPTIWFRNKSLMGTGESGLPFYNLQRQYEVTKNSWSDFGLGNSWGIGTAAAPFFLVTSWLQSLGVQNFVIESSFFGLLLLISGISICLITREMFPNLGEKYLLVSVIFYWFNPISLANVWGRFLYNYMVFFALLPLSYFLFLKGIRTKDFLYSIATALVCAIFSYALTSTPFNILLWFLYLCTAVFYLVIYKGGRERLFIFAYVLLTLISFTLINFWWISQLFTFILSSDYSTATSSFFTSSGNLSTLTNVSERLGQFINTLRLLHGTFFTDGAGWAKIYNFPFLSVIGFLPSLIILWVIYKFRGKKEVLLFGGLFILSLFLIKGNSEPFGGLFQIFFVNITPLQVFRNPFEKFGFLLPLVAAPLFGFGLNKFLENFNNTRYKTLFFGGALTFVALFWGFPFWTGLVFTSNEGTENRALRTYEVNVPSYYKEVNNWLKKNSENFRFVSLPIGGEAINYNWEKPYVGLELSSSLFDTPNISLNTTTPYYDGLVTQLTKYELEGKLLNFFPFIGAKYIVLREDIDFRQRQMADPSVVKSVLLDELEREKLITKRFAAGGLSVYDSNTNFRWPKIYLTPAVYASNTKDLAFLSNFFDNFPEQKVAVIDESNYENNFDYRKAIFVPNKIYFQKVSSPLPNYLTDEQLLGRLFYADHLPGDLIYPLIRVNEKVLEIREKNLDGWLLYRVGILGKRVAEIYRLDKLGKSENLITSTQKDYEDELSNMSPYIVGLIKRGGPVAGVIKDSLMFQWVLLGRIGLSSTSTMLSDILSKWDVKPTFELPISNNTYVIASFNLPVDGKYLLYGGNGGVIFLDGQKLALERSKPIDLKSGKHEISLNLTDSEIFKNVVGQQNQILLDENASPRWDFDIPGKQETYQVDFDYRFISGGVFGVKIIQNLENVENPAFSNDIKDDPKFHGWLHYSGEMTSAPGATKAYLIFTPSKESVCTKSWWGWTKCGIRNSQFAVEIKNLGVREVDTPELALIIDGTGPNGSSSTQTSFEEINPTLYKVHVDKKGTKPEVLVFSELFNSYWKVTTQDGKELPERAHLLVNDYANGWVIAKEGSYDLLINFNPQKVLKLGERISLVSAATAIILLTIFVFIRKKHAVS